MEGQLLHSQAATGELYGRKEKTIYLSIWRRLLIIFQRRYLYNGMRKLGVLEWLVHEVMTLYEGSKTSFRINGVENDEFEVNVEIHQ